MGIEPQRAMFLRRITHDQKILRRITQDQIITMLYLNIIMVIFMLNMLVLAMAMLIEGTQFGYQKILLLLQRIPSIDGFLNPLLDFVGIFLR